MTEDKIKITVEINGKQVPISDISEETLCKIRKADAEERIPVARLAKSDLHEERADRLLLKITHSIRDAVINKEIFGIAIDLRNGEVCNTNRVQADMLGRESYPLSLYANIQDLTPKDKP